MAKIDAAASDLTSDIRGVSFSKHILSIGPAQFIREVGIPMLDAIKELNENYPVSPAEEEWDLDITTDFLIRQQAPQRAPRAILVHTYQG